MEPIIDNDWTNCKNDPVDEPDGIPNVTKSWVSRERGVDPPGGPSNKTVLENAAEDILVQKRLQSRRCDLPGYPRSTFLMVFSPDGTKVASTHGNHNVYVSELASGKHVCILRGHPRTPWCISFHPSHPQLIGSGCLGGQVRVWDLSGGSETWTVETETVISSLAFHPRDQLLVIATFSELYFWNWSQPAPHTRVSTNNFNEKVKYVAFDSLGFKLITGIINVWTNSDQDGVNQGVPQQNGNNNPAEANGQFHIIPQSTRRMLADQQYESYTHLVRRYDSLVRNYHRLFMARQDFAHRAPRMTDRGTDPMETDGPIEVDWSITSGPNNSGTSNNSATSNNSGTSTNNDGRVNPGPFNRRRITVRRVVDGTINQGRRTVNGGANSSNMWIPVAQPSTGVDTTMLNADLATPTTSTPPSRSSSSNSSSSASSSSSTDSNSSTNSTASTNSSPRGDVPVDRPRDRTPFGSHSSAFRPLGEYEQRIYIATPDVDPTDPTRVRLSVRPSLASRGGVFMSPRRAGPAHVLVRGAPAPAPASPSAHRPPSPRAPPSPGPFGPDDTQMINESLDLIRDILRDSGARLLNLVTNMSLVTLANAEVDRVAAAGATGRPPRSTDRASAATPGAAIFTAAGPTPLAQSGLGPTPSRPAGTTGIATSLPSLFTAAGAAIDLTARTGATLSSGITSLTSAAPVSRPGTSSATTGSTASSLPELFASFGSPTAPRLTRIGAYRATGANSNGAASRPVLFTATGPTPLSASSSAARPTYTATSPSRTSRAPRLAPFIRFDRTARTGHVFGSGLFTASAPVPFTTPESAIRSVPSATPTAAAVPSAFSISGPFSASGPTPFVASTSTVPAQTGTDPGPTPPPEPRRTSNRLVFNLNPTPEERRLNSALYRRTAEGGLRNFLSRLYRHRFRVRNQNEDSAADSNAPSPDANNDSASSDDERSRSADRSSREEGMTRPLTSREAFAKVEAGVRALIRHSYVLSLMLSRGRRVTYPELLKMWDDLRRHVLALDIQTRPSDLSSAHYARSVMDRFRIITEMSRRMRGRATNTAARTDRSAEEPSDRREGRRQDERADSRLRSEGGGDGDETGPSRAVEENAAGPSGVSTVPETGSRRVTRASTRALLLANSTSNSNATNERSPRASPTPTSRAPPGPSPLARLSTRMRYFIMRKRLNANVRRRLDEEVRRRTRRPATTARQRRRPGAPMDVNMPRAEIRVRAMHVLSILFYMMMDCLEERDLSRIIIQMLKTIKRALRITCILLANNTNRENRSAENASEPASGSAESTPSTPMAEPAASTSGAIPTAPERGRGSSSSSLSSDEKLPQRNAEPISAANANAVLSPQRWSNRLAVQISAANRNYSSTARRRRDLYIEARREKALHKCDPSSNPIKKRKAQPPTASSRIPLLRRSPSAQNLVRRVRPPTSDSGSSNVPSYATPQPSTSQDNGPQQPDGGPPSGAEGRHAYRNRVELYRIAQLNAIRVRNAARERIRRLHTLRLYTSALREIDSIEEDVNNEGIEGFEEVVEEAEGPIPGARAGERPARRVVNPTAPRETDRESEPAGDRAPGAAPDEAARPIERSRRPGFYVARADQLESVINQIAVPIVQVNDLPVADNQPPAVARVQPIILAQNAIVLEDGLANMHGLLDAGLMPETLPTHRVQAWDFTAGHPPDISDRTKNMVVQRCRIHNDASIDISKDGRLLVALLPMPRLRSSMHRLGVYSLEWDRLGQCLHTAALEQSAVSVALSPTARYLAVGLGSRRFTYLPNTRNNVFALLYKLSPLENTSRTGLTPIKELNQNWEQQFTSLNCLRWAPQPGQGLVYANNTGQLIIMS